jgi:hypothetical protein
MDNQRVAIFEMEQLVFPAALYAIDPLSLDRARLCGRQFPLERWVYCFDRCDCLAGRRSIQASSSAFDLRKLWHLATDFSTQSFFPPET